MIMFHKINVIIILYIYSGHAFTGLPTKLTTKINRSTSTVKLTFFPSFQKNENKSPNDKNNKVIEFYEAWNRRDMDAAANCFAEDAIYDDTNFAKPLQGKEEIRAHFVRCADALPTSFQFALDDIAVDTINDKIGTRWHVEDVAPDNSSIKELPFTRGSSFYTLDKESLLIKSGFDVVEPAVVKPGDAGLTLLSIASKVIKEPIRAVPWLIWGSYIFIVFFSDGILPGANALALEQRTWEEVLNLSLNFFFVAPLLNLPFSPVVHPSLEGIFNLLLSWAALFGGFLSDEREDKKNIIPMIPTVVGMQFLTSAFLLPYLATRESEKRRDKTEPVCMNDLGLLARAFESKAVGSFLGFIGTFSVYWACFGRPEFGSLHERYQSLIDLLSIDRVGSSFIVDLAIFALFQGWLVDDDLARRGVGDNDVMTIRMIGKYVPFFGMAAYLVLRPSYQTRVTDQNL